jgi:hypothetical protein
LQQSAHEHVGHLQVQWHWHMHSALPWKSESGCTPSCCICWNSSSAFCACPHFTCPKIIAFQVNILRFLHFVEHSVGILHAPTFGIHVNQATPNKDISLATTLNDLLVSASALFNCLQTSTWILDFLHL